MERPCLKHNISDSNKSPDECVPVLSLPASRIANLTSDEDKNHAPGQPRSSTHGIPEDVTTNSISQEADRIIPRWRSAHR